MFETTSALKSILSAESSPSATVPDVPALKVTTPSTVSDPSTCRLPPMSTLLWTSKRPLIVLVALESLICNLAELICVLLAESSLPSNSLAAPVRVLASVVRLVCGLAPMSESSSLIPPTISESTVVVILPLQPTSAEMMLTFS